MNKYFRIIIIIISILLVGLTIFFYINSSTAVSIDTNETITEEDFQLTTTYKQNNTWEYTVKGELPDKCYTYTIEPVILESYPEQVQIRVNIKEVGKTECTPTLQCPYIIDVRGVFNASKEAQTSLIIDISSKYLPEI